jgi:hypothetical protein
MFSKHVQDWLLPSGLGVLAAIGLGLLYDELRTTFLKNKKTSFLKRKKGDYVEFPGHKRNRKAS